ncbi:hypothetical protein SFRURICE_010022 [Spodoptera frugiperda]|nr:hypothetical protein SFRURICE_010022 [Spodoptera frugiperda]
MLPHTSTFSCVVDPKPQLVDNTKSCFVQESNPLHFSRQLVAQRQQYSQNYCISFETHFSIRIAIKT